jgi:hypothetical protein
LPLKEIKFMVCQISRKEALRKATWADKSLQLNKKYKHFSKKKLLTIKVHFLTQTKPRPPQEGVSSLLGGLICGGQSRGTHLSLGH